MRYDPPPRIWELYALCFVMVGLALFSLWQNPGQFPRILLGVTPAIFLFWFLRRFS
jgi:hypothetical protein